MVSFGTPPHPCYYIFLPDDFHAYPKRVSDEVFYPVIFIPERKPFDRHRLSYSGMHKLVNWIEEIYEELELLLDS